MVSLSEAVGLTAGLLIALGLVPQVVRVWRLRDASQISLSFNLLSMSGTGLWIYYGWVLGLFSVIFWNSINIVLLSLLLVVKFRFGMEPSPARSGG